MQRDQSQLADPATISRSDSPSLEYVAEDLPGSAEGPRECGRTAQENRPLKRRRLDPGGNEVFRPPKEVCTDQLSKVHSFPPHIKELHASTERRLLRGPVIELLSADHFPSGIDGLLHFAATQESSVLAHAIDSIRRHGIQPNVRSSSGLTALDYAIHANMVRNVCALLDECTLEDFGGQGYLHRAIDAGANWRIIQAILRAGATPNYTHEGLSPLNRAFNVLAKSPIWQVTGNTYSQIQLLFDTGATWDSDDQLSAKGYYKFIQSLRRLNRVPQSFIKCLQYFLRSGANPTVTFPACYSTGNATFDAFALFHAEEAELAKAIVECVDIRKYGRDVATLLITSKLTICRPTSKGASRAELLTVLLRRGVKFLPDRNPLSQVIAEAPQTERIALLKAVMALRPDYLQNEDIVLGHPAIAVLDVRKPERWELMAALLGRETENWLNFRLQHDNFYNVADDWALFDSAFGHLLLWTIHSGARLTPESERAFKQCAAYVVTEHLVSRMNWTQILSEISSQLSLMVRLREHYDLPEMSIPNLIMLRILEQRGPTFRLEDQAGGQNLSRLSATTDGVGGAEGSPPEPWSELRSSTDNVNQMSVTNTQSRQQALAAEHLDLTPDLTDRYSSKLEEMSASYRRYQAKQQRGSETQTAVRAQDILNDGVSSNSASMFSLWA